MEDVRGRTWQLDLPNGRWLYWDGRAWQQSSAAPPPAAVEAPRAQGPSFFSALGQGLMTMAPGLAVEFFQRGAMYKTNPALAMRFALPALLSPLALALAPVVGRWVAVLLVLAGAAVLVWPYATKQMQVSGTMDAGGGIVLLSLISLLPRVWQAGSRT